MKYINLLLLLSIFSFNVNAGATCSRDEYDLIRAAGYEISPYSNCVDENVPGLVHNESLISVIDPKAFTETKHYVVNRNNGDVTEIPMVFHRGISAANAMNEVVRAYLEENSTIENKKATKVAVNCAADIQTNTSRISLSRHANGYTWEYHVLNPTTCEVREDFKSSNTTRWGHINIKQSVINRTPNGAFDLTAAPIEYYPRQSFTKFLGGNEDVQTKMISKPFFPRCRVKRNFTLNAAAQPIYNMNSTGIQSTDKAVRLTHTGQLPFEILSTPGSRKSTPVFLERKNLTGKNELAGAWQISDVKELDNLLVLGYSRDEVRVTLRDTECGKDVSSNWLRFEPVTNSELNSEIQAGL